MDEGAEQWGPVGSETGWPLNPDAPMPSDEELRSLAESDRQLEANVDAFWDEQSQLPLFRRSALWWIEVGASNVVGVLIGLAIAWFVLYGLVAAIGTLI